MASLRADVNTGGGSAKRHLLSSCLSDPVLFAAVAYCKQIDAPETEWLPTAAKWVRLAHLVDSFADPVLRSCRADCCQARCRDCTTPCLVTGRDAHSSSGSSLVAGHATRGSRGPATLPAAGQGISGTCWAGSRSPLLLWCWQRQDH